MPMFLSRNIKLCHHPASCHMTQWWRILLLTANRPHVIFCQQHQNSKAVPLNDDVKLSIETNGRSRSSPPKYLHNI
ncbi:putative NTE family protein [Trichinella pseudospiralis]